jgi:hypothetical protein
MLSFSPSLVVKRVHRPSAYRASLDRDASLAGVEPNRIEVVGRRLERRQNHLDGTRPVPRHLGDAVKKFSRDGDLSVGVRHGPD